MDEQKQTVVRNVVHRMGNVGRKGGHWFWVHKGSILSGMALFGAGTMLGAVRIIPPPEKFVKLGLFRIGTD